MNAKQVNASHRSLFLNGGRLDAVMFGAAQVAELVDESAHRREQYGRPTTECWSCGETRPDDTEVCPTCDAEAVPF